MRNDLEQQQDTTQDTSEAFASASEPPGLTSERSSRGSKHRDPLGRFTASAARQARIAGYRETLETTQGGLPAPWQALLRQEGALLLDASADYLDRVPGGLTTVKGRLRAPFRDFLELQDRLQHVMALLGFGAAKGEGSSSKVRPWSKLTRQEQEAAAAAAFAEVERNFTAARDEDES
jgi:hypothetical protein